MIHGALGGLARWPVKSMAGERLRARPVRVHTTMTPHSVSTLVPPNCTGTCVALR